MSHYTCMIIGENPESQLEPFNENLQMDRYEVGEISEDEKNRFVKWVIKKYPLMEDKSFDEICENYGEEWNGEGWEKDENGVWKSYSTYNPNSKWDWYQLGGRWMGYFKLKDNTTGELGNPGVGENDAEEGTCDQTLKGNIDFESMENESMEKAAKKYDEILSKIGHLPPNKTWDEILKGDKTIEEKRNEYWNQLRCIEYRKMDGWGDPDEFLVDRDTYVENAKNSSYSPYSILYEGKWYSKGEIGWWAVSNDKMTQKEWNEKVRKLINELPDDTLISLYDLHI